MEEHIGTCLTSNDDGEKAYMQKRTCQSKALVHAMHSIWCCKVPLTPSIGNKLYKSAIIPKLTYGIEAMSISEESLLQLEAFNSDSAKIIQGLPRQTANSAGVFSMGWTTMSACIDMIMLKFLWRVLLLSMDNVYKLVMLSRLYEQMQCSNRSKCKGPVF